MSPSSAVLAQIAEHRLVPVVVIEDPADACSLGDALVGGGLPLAEVTLRTPAGIRAIESLAERGDILVGAGTVVTPAQVDEAVAAGATFVVSPGLSRAVVERAAELDVLVVPGAVTATEVQAAFELGLGVVKFFPAGTSGGPDAIKALSAPFSRMRFVPTGGVSADNLLDYLAVPSVLAVGGSWMVPQHLLAARDTRALEARVRDAVALVRPGSTARA